MKNKKTNLDRGFTLVEMLIVLAIMSVVIGITVNGQRSFDRSIILSNTTYDVALSVRQAQAYGTSGRVASGQIITGYGYGLDVQSLPTKKYVLFADTSGSGCLQSNSTITGAPDAKIGDCIYTKGSDVVVQSVDINNDVIITGVCVYNDSSSYCAGTSNPSLSQVDINFIRPSQDAVIVAKNTSGGVIGGSGSSTKFDSACLRLSSSGNNRYLYITHVGVVSVKSSCNGI